MNYDDPKLTAYALGELEGSELADVQALIAQDEAAAAAEEPAARDAAAALAAAERTRAADRPAAAAPMALRARMVLVRAAPRANWRTSASS